MSRHDPLRPPPPPLPPPPPSRWTGYNMTIGGMFPSAAVPQPRFPDYEATIPPTYQYNSNVPQQYFGSTHRGNFGQRSRFCSNPIRQRPSHDGGAKCSRSDWTGNSRSPAQPAIWKCDTCKVNLESERALRAHIDSHITCTACKFEGSRTVVKAHFDSVHGRFTGNGFKTVTIAIPGCPVQRFRICVGNHPDDVQKWISERRQRFPRQQVQQPEQQKQSQEANLPLGLASLLADYGSSSDENEVTPSIRAISKKNSKDHSDYQNENSTVIVKRDSPNHTKRQRIEGTDIAPRQRFELHKGDQSNKLDGSSHKANDRMFNAGSRRTTSKFPGKPLIHGSKSSNLLRKLLEQEVRRESTLTLQLFRYIVDSDFLEDKQVR